MKLLAVDAGNTRIKWGLHDGTRWRNFFVLPAAQAGELAPAWAMHAQEHAVDRVMIASVAGRAVDAGIAAAVPPPAAQYWLKSTAAQCGVSNGYTQPAQLGCDRWAALIAAHHMAGAAHGPMIVANAGTALTVDALTADGRFLGGIIVPGDRLMREALAYGTAALVTGSSRTDPAFDVFPRNTGDAIASGIAHALAGSIERMALALERREGRPPLCVLSGGAQALIAPRLNLELRIVDNLVLEGLLIIANDPAVALSPL